MFWIPSSGNCLEKFREGAISLLKDLPEEIDWDFVVCWSILIALTAMFYGGVWLVVKWLVK